MLVLVPGDEPVVVLVLELEEPPDGSFSFTTVVLLSFFSPGGLVTVVSFCSQAVSNAAPAKMQISLFIVSGFDGRTRFLFTATPKLQAKSSSWSSSYRWSTDCRSGWSWWCWFRFFAHMPRVTRRWPECRCISS